MIWLYSSSLQAAQAPAAGLVRGRHVRRNCGRDSEAGPGLHPQAGRIGPRQPAATTVTSSRRTVTSHGGHHDATKIRRRVKFARLAAGGPDSGMSQALDLKDAFTCQCAADSRSRRRTRSAPPVRRARPRRARAT